MTTKVSIKGYTATSTVTEVILTNLDPKVTRTMTKSDLVYVPYPVDDVDGGGFGFDLGFSQDVFKVDITVPFSTAHTTYKNLWYMMKVDTTNKTFYYDGDTFAVLAKMITMTQVAGQGNKRTISMELIVITE